MFGKHYYYDVERVFTRHPKKTRYIIKIKIVDRSNLRLSYGRSRVLKQHGYAKKHLASIITFAQIYIVRVYRFCYPIAHVWVTLITNNIVFVLLLHLTPGSNWTFSILAMSLIREGAQVCTQYSKWRRSIAQFEGRHIWVLTVLKVRLRKPTTFFAFVIDA